MLLVDDLIATGGTACAAPSLLHQIGVTISACAFIVDLPEVGGSEHLKNSGFDVISLCEFEGE